MYSIDSNPVPDVPVNTDSPFMEVTVYLLCTRPQSLPSAKLFPLEEVLFILRYFWREEKREFEYVCEYIGFGISRYPEHRDDKVM